MFGRKQHSFTKIIHIQASPQKLFAFLSEPRSAIGLQPLVVEVIEHERGVDEQGRPFRRYQAAEQFRFFGFIPYVNRINVVMTLAVENEKITHEVHSPGAVYLHSTYTLQPMNEGTVVVENVVIESPRFLAGYVVRTASQAHDQLMENLKRVMEDGDR
jgi:hypothetical protein